jgi:hypothetical protein
MFLTVQLHISYYAHQSVSVIRTPQIQNQRPTSLKLRTQKEIKLLMELQLR